MGGNVEAYYDSIRQMTEHQRKLRQEEHQKLLKKIGGEDWPSWHEYYFGIANAVKLKSKDKHTKIGAIIVGQNGEIISTGYNSLPRGMNDFVPERYERPEKYNWMEHAERNAIYNAARVGASTVGGTMYMTCGMSCVECARAVVQAGIVEIHLVPGAGAKGGKYDVTYDTARTMYDEAGVVVYEHPKMRELIE